MTFLLAISLVIIFSTAASGWEHRGPIIAREEPREYAAWYQMPQGAAAYPPSAYERAVAASAAASQYAGYPRPYSRSPDYYPETAVTNNMVPASRKAAAAAGYYIPAGANTPDTYQISAIDRYFPLLGRKRINNLGKNTFGSRKQQTLQPQPRVASTTATPPNAASVMRTLKPRRPLIETWKCVRKPCPRLSTLKPLPLVNNRTKMIRQSKKVTPRPESSRTFATVEGIKLASVKPYTFRPRHKQSNKKMVKITTAIPSTTTTTTVTTTTAKAVKTIAKKIIPSTTTKAATTSATTFTTTPSTTTTTQKLPSTTSTSLPSTTTTIEKKTTEVTKRREIKPTNKTFKPLNVIKVTPFTTKEPQTLSPEALSASSTSPPSTLSPTHPSTTSSSSISTTSKPIDFPYSLLWGKNSASKPQNAAANSSTTFTTALKPTIPLQIVTSRIYQLLERELTNSAMEYEEMRQIREDFKNKPWITEEFIAKAVAPERKQKRKEKIVVKEEEEPEAASYEDEIVVPVIPERKRKRPNAELISAIKDVVRKFKASLDRTGVNDDVRHMQSQLESTWNDLRRGINRSWTAFRQSAENALLSPSLSTSSSSSSALTTLQQPPIILPPGLLPPLPPPSPGTLLTGEPYPYIITALQQQQQLKHHSFMKDSNIYGSAKSNNNNNNTDTNTYLQNDINNNSNNVENVDAMLLYNGSSYGSSGKSQSKRLLKKQKISPFTELLLQNLYDSNIDDSGKLESWIERAHQMLADSVSEDDVKAILDSQKNDGPSKIAKNPTQIPKDKPVKASSSVIKAEKINPKFNLNDQN